MKPQDLNGIIEYLVYRLESGAVINEGSANFLTFNVTSLKPFHSYTFYVIARNIKYNLQSNASNLATNRTFQGNFVC